MRKLLSNLTKQKFNSLITAWQWFVNIKDKVVNFDIKPAKPIIPELLEQAQLEIDARNVLQAKKILKQILALNNTNLDALYMLAELSLLTKDLKTSSRLIRQAIKYHPQETYLYKDLGHVRALQGRHKSSSRAYKKALHANPEDAVAQHFFNAVTHNNTAIAPTQYIVGLFDSYAENFENSLTNLGYSAPKQIVEYLSKFIESDVGLGKVVDLGCGTGWLGEALNKQFIFQELVGVDLAANMLQKAKGKQIYHSLHNLDILEYLRSQSADSVELVVSTDVLIYIGDLNELFREIYRILKPGAWFGFSLEKLATGNFKLHTTGRYQHSLDYIKSLYKQYHFSKMYSQTIDLRMEYGNMVDGYLVLLQK